MDSTNKGLRSADFTVLRSKLLVCHGFYPLTALNNVLSSNSGPLNRNCKTDRFMIFCETQSVLGLHLYTLTLVQNNLGGKF